MIEYIELRLLGPLETYSMYLCWPVPARSYRYVCVCVCTRARVCVYVSFSLGVQVGVGDAKKQTPLAPILLNFLMLIFFFRFSHFFPTPTFPVSFLYPACFLIQPYH